jgi:hypothetical protein
MAKSQAGLLSLGTTGKFAGSMVFVQGKSGTVIRQLVTPTNPRSAAQTGTRSMMQWASREWAQLTAPEQATWLDAVAKADESPFNAFIRVAMNQWKNGLGAQSEYPTVTEIAPAIPTAPTATVTGRQVTIAWVDPAARVFAVAIHFDSAVITTPGPANAVKVVDEGVLQGIVADLAPGTYHYRVRAFSHEGIFGPATADATFVIT